MKVSYKWLKTMVEVPDDARQLAHSLDMTGTAVDDLYEAGINFEGIVVGRILSRERHPNADTLWVTTVDVGERNRDGSGSATPLQIVCGAQNFKTGDRVAVALEGAVLPDGTKIKRSKLRGVMSQGMNCSERELGLGGDYQGIMILGAEAKAGQELSSYLKSTDTIFNLEITPNRPDCMSMLGVAREVGAILKRPYHLGCDIAEPELANATENHVRVTIDDSSRCARYTARVITGVKVGPSPTWLVERVNAAGSRSINNVVDVTNYIMYELGQPLHAFDLDTLSKDGQGRAHIVVRAAADGERFTTLDDIERVLDSDITAIVDGNAADMAGATIALAGVMGGLDSEVTETTVNILLESATFSAGHTSRTSRRLQLFSEAASRYERGVDDATCAQFSQRAAYLIAQVSGGRVASGVVDAYPAPRPLPALRLRPERLRAFVGADITSETMSDILRRLGCIVEDNDAASASEPGSASEPASLSAPRQEAHCDGVRRISSASALAPAPLLTVYPPSYRPDLEREIDLYEEVLRVWGMERVPSSLPGGAGRVGRRTEEQRRLDTVATTLRACGLHETMTFAFAAADDLHLLGMPQHPDTLPVELLNPINSEQTVMRESIIPGLLRSVAYNQSHGVADVQLFELGTVFAGHAGSKLPSERRLLAAVLTGSWSQPTWNNSVTSLDFFDVKGVIQNLAGALHLHKVRFVPLNSHEAPWLQPGQAAAVWAGKTPLGWLGQIHPRSAAAFHAEPPVLALELEVNALLEQAHEQAIYSPLSVFPAVELDLAIVVDEQISAEQVLSIVRATGGSLLEDARLFDLFRDTKKLGKNRKSLALALSFRAADRTLTLAEAEKLLSRIVRKLAVSTGAEQRV
jgi:phenylalanyl-tRNA synthetase beta chain